MGYEMVSQNEAPSRAVPLERGLGPAHGPPLREV